MTATIEVSSAEQRKYNALINALVKVVCDGSEAETLPGIGVIPLVAAARHILLHRPPSMRLPIVAGLSPKLTRLAKLFTDLERELTDVSAVIEEFEAEQVGVAFS